MHFKFLIYQIIYFYLIFFTLDYLISVLKVLITVVFTYGLVNECP